jgi:hypothetical protein
MKMIIKTAASPSEVEKSDSQKSYKRASEKGSRLLYRRPTGQGRHLKT